MNTRVRRFFSQLLPFLFLLWAAEACALSGTLSAQDLIRLLSQFGSSAHPRSQALAAELQRKLAEAGVSLTDNGFVIAGEVPPDPQERPLIDHCDNLLGFSVGSWALSQGQFIAPGAGPMAGRVDGGVWSAFVDGNGTTLGFRVTPGNVGIDLNLRGSYAGTGTGALRWDAGYFDPFDPVCRVVHPLLPPVCAPRWKCTVLGYESFSVAAHGSVHVQAVLNLDVVLEQNGNGRYQIVIGRQALTGATGPLSVGTVLNVNLEVETNFLPHAPLWRALRDNMESEAENSAGAAAQSTVAATNAQLRARLPVVLELPQVDPAILKLVLEIVHSPIVHRFIEQNFAQVVFYLLVDDRQALSQLLVSAGACEATRLARAGMAMPALYTDAPGACVAADPEGADQGRYFSDSACTRALAFRPTPYIEYCNEVLAPGPNAVLGNAAAWTPDANQPNDPLPSVPSRKWTVPQGAQMAITAESLTGKTAPMMKRVRWREIQRSADIPNLAPLYWGCLQEASESCRIWGPSVGAPVADAAFLGYIKTAPESGTVPLYWVCVAEGEQGCTRWEVRTFDSSGNSLIGYVQASQAPGTIPLFSVCAQESSEGDCRRWALGTAGYGQPLGYAFAGTTAPLPNCALEMRIYKKDPTATGLTPVIAFHGGSWQYRGGAFAGFESEMAHFTEQGFVVFAPFYRLVSDGDGNAACNQAPWEAVVADTEAALDWVKLHGAAFGAKPGKLAVAGASAGAHLAGWLVTHRAADVAAGMLLYAPSDVRDFLEHARPGDVYEPFAPSLDILSRFYGADVSTISLGNPPQFLLQNSFHDLVRAGGSAVPPVFLLHGLADTLVPSNQSVLLCNAYGGSAVNDGGGPNRRATFTCGSSGSRLHLFQQAQHPLDICVINEPLNVCFSGDNESRLLVVDSMRQARSFLISKVNQAPAVNAGADRSAISGSVVTLGGAGTDVDGTIVTYSWTQTAGPGVALVNAASANATFTAPFVGMATVLTFQLTVTDNNGGTAADTVNVTVTTNQPPAANAGADQSVLRSTAVTLAGNGTDLDGAIAAYGWAQTAGPAVALMNANTATATFTAPHVTAATLLTFRLTVTDNHGGTGTDTVNVTVNVPPPVPITSLAPLYFGCLVWSYGPENDSCRTWGPQLWSPPSEATFLGYIKTAPESGTLPLYWVCGMEGEYSCVRWDAHTSENGSAPVGYLKASQQPGTVPLYFMCVQEDSEGYCRRSALTTGGWGWPLGYIYNVTQLPPN
jgi:acetyl esterase/lipase